jgi:hypothetical protein
MVVSNPSNGLICQAGGSVTLNAQLTGGSAITWSPNTNLSTTSGASTVASPTTTTVYTMSATVAGCGSVSATQTVGVIDAVAFTPTSTPAAVCAGNTAALASNLASSGFTFSSMSFAPSTAVSPTILCNACGVDDGSADNIAIPFTYNFFGNNYTTVNIGTNGGFSLTDNVKGLVASIKEKFPNAKLYAVQGSWGWGGNGNKTIDDINKYYDKFRDNGVKVLEPPIGKTLNPHNYIDSYKKISKSIDNEL